MAPATHSRWRQESRRVIETTLADLARTEPAADNRRKRAVLRDAYPFGERAMHPYKCWCQEVRLALGAKPKAAENPRVDVLWMPEDGRRLIVACGWCRDRGSGTERGCFACEPLRFEVRDKAEAIASVATEAQRFDLDTAEAFGDPAPFLVCGDWWEEQGLPVLAAHWRKEGERRQAEARP